LASVDLIHAANRQAIAHDNAIRFTVAAWQAGRAVREFEVSHSCCLTLEAQRYTSSVSAIDKRPYEAILETAASNGCDLIVMASHGRSGVTALLLGSETQKVLTHSKLPVLVHM
jgi:nucleotide-binding universal stress UspA family protein